MVTVAPPRTGTAVPVPRPDTSPERRRRAGTRLLSRLLSLALGLVLSLAAVALGLVAFGSLTGTWGLVPVLTGSMRPGIQPGDLVVVVPEPTSAVRAGQVLDFHPPGEGGASVTHRVVSVSRSRRGTFIRTKGDANNVADAWNARLDGTRAWQVRAVIPKAGYLAVVEHDPLSRLVVELALLAGGIGTALGTVWRRPQEEPSEETPAGVAVR